MKDTDTTIISYKIFSDFLGHYQLIQLTLTEILKKEEIKYGNKI